MDSFDQALKYLLQHQPADFIGFALGDRSIQVLGPVPSGLPSRSRDVDGGYLIAWGGTRFVAHLEFHRRHQSADELAIDVGEAQIRFYRRERVKVLSLVWDLYGTEDEPFVERRTLDYGVEQKGAGSQVAYLKVNLRRLDWKRLLAKGPPALWPLVALARRGANAKAVREAREAIEARTDLTSTERANHLAVLWFVAEAEDVPVQAMREYISEERLMESTLYQGAIRKGEAKSTAETIIRILSHRLGALDPALRDGIRVLSDLDTLTPWYEEALLAVDADAAQRLAEKIRKALLA